MAEANQLLRAARQARVSLTSPGFPLSRSELAELVNAAVYRRTGREGVLDEQYVAKLERGVIGWPGSEYRRAFREVLGAATDSELGFRYDGPTILFRRAAPVAAPLPPPPGLADETERERLARILSGRCRGDRAVVGYLREVLAAQWHIDDTIGSARMLPVTLAEIDLVEQLTRQARGGVHAGLVAVAGEYHAVAAQLSDDTGDHRAAIYHSDRAMQAAQETNDANLLAAMYGLRSHIAWGAHDAPGTIALAEAAQRDAPRLSPGVAAFTAQMQARGHALQHQDPLTEQLLDRTEQLTAQAREHPEDEPWWTYRQTPDRALFQRGLAYLELGHHRHARDLLAQARAGLAPSYRRDHGRWAADFALACAHDGDLSQALTAGWQAVAIALDAGSVYTIAALGSLRRVLQHQQPDPAILDEFDQALHELITPARI